jgi:hypothetical protein
MGQNTECPKRLEPMGILIISLIFIHRLKLKVKRLGMDPEARGG